MLKYRDRNDDVNGTIYKWIITHNGILNSIYNIYIGTYYSILNNILLSMSAISHY